MASCRLGNHVGTARYHSATIPHPCLPANSEELPASICLNTLNGERHLIEFDQEQRIAGYPARVR